MQTTTSGRGHFQSTKAEQVWERGPDGVGTCLGRGASTGTGGEGHTGWEEAQHTSAPKTVVVVSDDSALQYGHAGATGHAVVRLDDLNTRSYHRAVLEIKSCCGEERTRKFLELALTPMAAGASRCDLTRNQWAHFDRGKSRFELCESKLMETIDHG